MATDKIYKITVPTPYPVGDVHIYVIEGDVLSIVDAGVKTAAAREALTTQLKDIGYKASDIEQIILTHHHPDHIGLVDDFPNAKGIYGHRNNRPWLTRDETFLSNYEQFFQQLYVESGVPKSFEVNLSTLRAPLRFIGEGDLSGELKEDDRLPGHDSFKVLETPGHASSHLSFYREADGILFGGDLLLATGASNPLLEPPENMNQARPRPLIDYRNSLMKCLPYAFSEIFPGHGPNITDPIELINKRLKKQEGRAKKAFELLQGRTLTAFEVCQKLFPMHIEKQFGLTMSDTIGQLDFLEELNRIKKIKKDGIYYYSISK